MKTVLPLLSLIFLLFLFALPKSNVAEELLDVDGDILRNGGSYYIVPAFRGKGGGLELAKTEGETCPRTVVQARSETQRGLPARIWTPPRIAILRPGFYLNIEFQPRNPSACHQDSRLQWTVEESQVVIASKEEERLFGPFKIQPYRDDYKLVYCDVESEGNKSDRCEDLGISIDDENNRRLVVLKDGEPLAVRFVKAHRRDDSARIMSVV